MYSFFQIIVFLNTILFESIVGNIVTVGNYSKLNPKTCGLSRHSIGMDTNLCMTWHKDITSPIMGGMNARLGDAPWVTQYKYSKLSFDNGITNVITSYCTGAIISEQWILTVAHCMINAFDIKVYLGHIKQNDTDYFDISNETYIHPKYSGHPKHEYDLALVRMTKPIDNSANQTMFANSICLPEKWQGTDCFFKPIADCELTEYGMVGGWGTGNFPILDNLQVGYWRLYNIRWDLSPNANSTDLHPHSLLISKMGMAPLGTHSICGGDSGGPVWQYQMGRAVIVGVVSSNKHDHPITGCQLDYNYGPWSFCTYVDQAIDWIKNCTKLNK